MVRRIENMWFAARRSAPGDDIGRTLGLDKTTLLDHLQQSYLHLRARGTRGGEHAGGDERVDRLADQRALAGSGLDQTVTLDPCTMCAGAVTCVDLVP